VADRESIRKRHRPWHRASGRGRATFAGPCYWTVTLYVVGMLWMKISPRTNSISAPDES